MEFKELEQFQEIDRLRYNLNLRSNGKPASKFDWCYPEQADGIPILARTKVTESDPNVKTFYNNFAVIQRTKAGYLGSNITRVYSDDVQEDLKKKYEEFDNLNHFKTKLKKIMFAGAGWGNSYSLCYLDAQKRVRFKQIPSWNAKIFYDDNGEPIKGFVYYTENKKQIVYVYDDLLVLRYEKNTNSNQYILVEESIHGFSVMPLVEWKNNDNIQGNAQIAVSLMDAYDRLMSDNITEWATFRQAYLLLKNLGIIDEDKKGDLQKSMIIEASGDNAEAKFITKDVNPEFVKFITQECWTGIWIVASSIDSRALASLSNATAFQIRQMYNNMDVDCDDTEAEWRISLEYLDRILQSYWLGLDTKAVTQYDTSSISYEFVRNKPIDIMTWLKDMLTSGGRLPQKEIFIKAGYDEQKAEELASEAMQESYESIPSGDNSEVI